MVISIPEITYFIATVLKAVSDWGFFLSIVFKFGYSKLYPELALPVSPLFHKVLLSIKVAEVLRTLELKPVVSDFRNLR